MQWTSGVGFVARLHPVYWVGWAVILTLLVYEHRLVRPDNLSQVGRAFFNMNAVIGVIYLLDVVAAVLLSRS